MPFSINIPELPTLLAALAAYPEIAQPILEDASNAALLSLIPYLASYPPKPAQSTYRRSGTLGRTWASARPAFTPISSGFEGSVGNPTPYAIYAQGEFQPPWMEHWQTDEDVVGAHRADMEAYFETALQRIVEAIDVKV
jgi:hypothetical protein